MGFLLVARLLVFMLGCFFDFFEIACIAVPIPWEDYNDRFTGKAFDQLLATDQAKHDKAALSMGAGSAPAPNAAQASAAAEAGNEDPFKGLSAAVESEKA